MNVWSKIQVVKNERSKRMVKMDDGNDQWQMSNKRFGKMIRLRQLRTRWCWPRCLSPNSPESENLTSAWTQDCLRLLSSSSRLSDTNVGKLCGDVSWVIYPPPLQWIFLIICLSWRTQHVWIKVASAPCSDFEAHCGLLLSAMRLRLMRISGYVD